MTAMRNYLNKKGQGIVEYALLLAFIVGIAVALQGVGLKDAVVGVFDDVAMVLAGNSDGLDLSTSEGRHAADLANMKKFGIAMANEFSFSSSVGARNKLDSDGKFVSQKNFSVLYVFADGTADLYVDGDAYTNAFWLSDAISKAFIDSMAREIHPDVLEMLMDEMEDLPMLERMKEVIAKKKLRKMYAFIRMLRKAKIQEIGKKLRALWMNRNIHASRGSTSAVSDMMLLTMPTPPTAQAANRSLWQRGIISGAVA